LRSATLIRTKVIEFCLGTADGALEIATELVKGRPDAVLKILTVSDLEADTSVLHVIVPEGEVDGFIATHMHILGHAGNVLASN
jgi:hypothetical protein